MITGSFPKGSVIKNLPAKQETRVQSLSREDLLEKEMATTPVLLPGKSREWRSMGGCSPWGHKGSDTTERLHLIDMINTYFIWSPFSSLPTPEKSILQMMRFHTYFLNELVYLAVLGLICGMQNLRSLLQLVESFSCHARSLVAACGIFSPEILQLYSSQYI